MKKLVTFLVCSLLICLSSCKKENKDKDIRDDVTGRYSYEQTGSATLSGLGTLPLDSKGTFTIDKVYTSDYQVKFYGSDLLSEGYVSNNNGKTTLTILAATKSYTSYLYEGDKVTYTVSYSPCTVNNHQFTTKATVSGTYTYKGNSYALNGNVVMIAQ